MVDSPSLPTLLLALALASCGSRSIDDGLRGAERGGAGTGGGDSGITGGSGGAGGMGGAGGTGAFGGFGASTCATPLDCPCTRRPGMGNCFNCPMGRDESQSRDFPARGGVFGLKGQQGAGVPFWITIPPRALATDAKITITETSIPPPRDFVDYSPVYVIESTIPTSLPLELVVPYSNKSRDVQNLSIYFADKPSDAFMRVEDSVVSAGFIEGTIRRFGAVFVGAPKTADQQACP